MPQPPRFSRRLPDLITEELRVSLKKDKTYSFNELFEEISIALKQRDPRMLSERQEAMTRLRAYEKLQNLVVRELSQKFGKSYRGTEKLKTLEE